MRAAATAGGVLAASIVLVASAQPPVESLKAEPQAAALFAPALAARAAAEATDAYLYAPAAWQRAERALDDAADAFGRGARDAAAERGAEAAALYYTAERQAIEAALLAEPRSTLAQARKARAGRHAPQAIARAEALIAEAQEALASNPPDEDGARRLANDAATEARRALALGSQLEGGASTEQIVREWQDALARIARSAGLELPIDVAPQAGAAALVEAIERDREARAGLERGLAERNEQIRDLQSESSTLAGRLDELSRERIELARQLESEAAARERLASVERMFGPEEAVLLRERDDILIRLLGLRFPAGSTRLGREQQALLDKVIEAIGLHAERDVIVEGHTDAAGSADSNLELSRARARSVREYLVASGRVPAARVSSEGYGETHPVASNDTDEGRARNRRIDVRLRALAGS
jgi:outer membrane protein OmpA-like peptidoglycan-associated protein